MRFWIAGPRMFGGLIRPGISFGRENFVQPRYGASDSPAIDFVYVIAGDHGLVKVGISTDPQSRLATLQTASPHRLRLAFTAPAYGKSYTIEQEAHAILGANRASGEWFSVSPDLAIAAIFAAADRTGCSLSEPAPQTSLAEEPLQTPLAPIKWPDLGIVGWGAVILFLFWILGAVGLFR